MPKYGRGLNREIVSAVNRGIIIEPFGISEIKNFAFSKGWQILDNYINVTLANAASQDHSPTSKKYFHSLGDGNYKVRFDFKGLDWE